MMKRKFISCLCAVMVSGALLAGCGSSGNDESAQAQETQVTAEQETEASEIGTEAADAEEAQAEPSEETETVQQEEEPGQPAAAALEDGVYNAEFDTDSSMFHVNEACEGLGVLTVENGQMTIHVSLVSKNIVGMFVGTAEDAQKEGAEVLQPTTDTVTYSDGISEEVYGFDIPVPVLDEEFDLAIIGTKDTWYDHKVSVSNPVKAE